MKMQTILITAGVALVVTALYHLVLADVIEEWKNPEGEV